LRTHISISHLDLGALEHYSLLGSAFIIQNCLRLINNIIFLINSLQFHWSGESPTIIAKQKGINPRTYQIQL